MGKKKQKNAQKTNNKLNKNVFKVTDGKVQRSGKGKPKAVKTNLKKLNVQNKSKTSQLDSQLKNLKGHLTQPSKAAFKQPPASDSKVSTEKSNDMDC